MIFGRRERTVVAIDLGTSKVVTAVASVGPDGGLRLLGLGEAVSAGIRKGDVIDAQAAKEALRESVAAAEESAETDIEDVFLSLSGAHVDSVRQRGTVEIEGGDSVADEDLETAREAAERINLPAERMLVATLTRGYRIDGSEPIDKPVGMDGHRLEGEFLVVHAVGARLRNLIARAQELGLEVVHFTLSPLASAEAVLAPERKKAGALAIDLGGGLTHYAVYYEGRPAHVGVIGVGGDHVTQDISHAFGLPQSLSEALKCGHGAVSAERGRRGEVIEMKPKAGFAGKKVLMGSLCDVMKARWEETFTIVRESIPRDLLPLLGGGIVLTGGGSRTKGIAELARQVFKKDVSLVEGHAVSGNVENLARPELSTVIGTLLYCAREEGRENGAGGLGGMFRRMFGR